MAIYNTCKLCNGSIAIVNETYNLVECQECKLVFCSTQFTQEAFIKTYDDLYNASTDSVYARHAVAEFKELKSGKPVPVGYNRSRLIKKHILNGKCTSVLEIGSGVGLVGKYVQQADANVYYQGIEIDQKAFDKSQELGLNTYRADFSHIDTLDRKFDVIMLWEVIEHLQDLKQFLSLAHSALNEGGSLILSTPNYLKIHNYPNRKKDQIFQNEPPIHLNFFTKENMVHIFTDAGYSKSTASLKKLPYLEPAKMKFYKNALKSVLGGYQGPTLYFEAYK
ncbi:MAG: 2-polyprenyl-3-methyl-5-hydroxy-6-metoxy-1,4-benzoquinol methylase [Patiriisocius sp.]|jgi:2-polyprenyl-3-methyl-5-hydroxy-6-metoxy-1,4-benzoquinol methylase